MPTENVTFVACAFAFQLTLGRMTRRETVHVFLWSDARLERGDVPRDVYVRIDVPACVQGVCAMWACVYSKITSMAQYKNYKHTFFKFQDNEYSAKLFQLNDEFSISHPSPSLAHKTRWFEQKATLSCNSKYDKLHGWSANHTNNATIKYQRRTAETIRSHLWDPCNGRRQRAYTLYKQEEMSHVNLLISNVLTAKYNKCRDYVLSRFAETASLDKVETKPYSLMQGPSFKSGSETLSYNHM